MDGKDLLYEYKPTLLKDKDLKNVDIEPKSIVSEYGHPPGGDEDSGKDLKATYDNRYVLLNYAIDESRRKKKKSDDNTVKAKKKIK